MGRGFLRRRKMAQYADQVKAMQEETNKIISDPEGAFQRMAKPLISQLQSATYEKNKLSALVCALLETSGGTATIKRGQIDQFQKHRITILTETPEGDDGANGDIPITFTYRAEFVAPDGQVQPPVEAPTEPVVLDENETVIPEVAAVIVDAQAPVAE